MFNVRVSKQARKMENAPATAKPSRPSRRPWLEVLEDRIMPSDTPMNPLAIISTASPPAVAAAMALTSEMIAMMEQRDQLIATLEQNLSGFLKPVDQLISQEVSSFEQQWDRLLGITPPVSNPALNNAVAQLSRGTGAGQGHASGSGSRSGATTTAHEHPHPRLGASANVSGSGSASGSGPYSGSATVTGKVWLDNNGDSSIDNNEMDYAGATVYLWRSEDNGSTWSVADSDITSNVTRGYNYSLHVGYGYPWPSSYIYKIQVAFPSTFEATIPGGASQINAQGYSQTFGLSSGGTAYKTGGLASMNVNIVGNDPPSDDPNGPTEQNTVTLRDTIETNNNGGGALALDDITFTNPLNGQALTGTITLQKALDTVTRGVTISGPGAGSLTIQGQGNAANPFRIFNLNAGQRVTIKGLTITGGYLPGGAGGAILSSNLVTLSGLRITKNMATYGGGIYVNGGAVTMSGGTITQNYTSGAGNLKPTGGGGIWVGSGSLTLKNNVSVGNNHADNGGYGGGMFVESHGTAAISGGTFQYNTTGNSGGGIYNSQGTLTLKSNVQIFDNSATNQGGGMYLHNGSTTTFNGCTVAANTANTGKGVYQQNNATITQPMNLTDNDDPGGKPVKGN